MMAEDYDPAGARVIELRDAARRAAGRIDAGGVVLLPELRDTVRSGLDAVHSGDLADAEETVRTQFEAFLRRLTVLVENHPGPIPATELDLPSDARFLRDMAEYLTRKYGLENAP